MSTVRANNYYDASGGSNAQLYGVASPPNSMGFRNRILNGDCRVDQRNAGASVTASGAYTLDRFFNYRSGGAYTVQRSTTAPAGFANSMLMTNTTAASPTTYSFFGQIIEGFNVADLAFGTASAASITVSFWANSSVTGVYSVSVLNGNNDRAYAAQYTINAANTWEYKTITIPGDTSGTWATGNTAGLVLRFNLGSPSGRLISAGSWQAANADGATGSTGAATWANTTNATFYITGVQLEAGSVASPFERRDYGRELMMCQRYYYANTNSPIVFMPLISTTDNTRQFFYSWPVTMRAAPTVSSTVSTGTAGNQYASAYGVNLFVTSLGNTTTTVTLNTVTATAEL